MVDIGQKAPDFKLPSHDGEPVELSAYQGKSYVVLSVYPAAFTGG